MSDNIHKGHRGRVKKRYITEGNLNTFEDHQALELLLFYCYAQKDTNEIAHRMISQFGSLHNLLESHPLEISRRCNVTENVAVLVSLVPHMARRLSDSKWGERPQLTSSRAVGKFCADLFSGVVHEAFYLICLDNQRQVLGSELLHKGSVDSTVIYPRLVVECALKYKAASVMLAHNHPGGKLSPSKGDMDVTNQIINALNTIEVETLDHMIVAGKEYYSFAEHKLLHLSY